MNPIRTNKPVFFADDGEPLASGYIYVGMPGQDPRNFPKTVKFEDSGGSQFTAAQPLRTNAQGQISYNGKAIIALVEGDYSLLILDRNMVQLKDGWTPTVSNANSGGGSTVGTQVGLLLEDIKLFDVTPGQTVRNVGKIIAQDKYGADWLVVSNTGNPADDLDLIDFANGAQGQRIANNTYWKDVVSSGEFILATPVSIESTSNATPFRQVWTTIDASSVVPAEATSIKVRVRVSAQYGTNTISNKIDVTAFIRKTGSGLAPTATTRIGEASDFANSNETVRAVFVSEVTVGKTFGDAASLDIYLTVNDPFSGSNNTSPRLDVTVVGYTINARDLI